MTAVSGKTMNSYARSISLQAKRRVWGRDLNASSTIRDVHRFAEACHVYHTLLRRCTPFNNRRVKDNFLLLMLGLWTGRLKKKI